MSFGGRIDHGQLAREEVRLLGVRGNQDSNNLDTASLQRRASKPATVKNGKIKSNESDKARNNQFSLDSMMGKPRSQAAFIEKTYLDRKYRLYESNIIPRDRGGEPQILYWIDNERVLFSGFLGPAPTDIVAYSFMDWSKRKPGLYVWGLNQPASIYYKIENVPGIPPTDHRPLRWPEELITRILFKRSPSGHERLPAAQYF